MLQKNQLQFTLAIALCLSLVAYHLTNIFIQEVSTDVLILYKIAQFVSLTVLFYAGIHANWLTRILLRDNYIGGNYVGQSQDLPISHENSTKAHIEIFSVTQNIFETTISGKSFLQTNNGLNLISTWNGKSFDGNKDTYVFGLELSTSKTEYAIAKITFSDKEAYGIYYSGMPGSESSANLEARKIDKQAYLEFLKNIPKSKASTLIESAISPNRPSISP